MMVLYERAAKLLLSIANSLARFLENYRKKLGLKSRSLAFEKAIRVVRSRRLESAYREANREFDRACDIVNSDGLSDETW